MTEKNKEQRILVVMRKVLANVIKDATPRQGKDHPLSQETLDDIRECFKLIAIREQELNQEETKMVPVSVTAKPMD